MTGEIIRAGHSLSLRSGCAQLAFVGGTTVILEGPARFTIDSSTAITLIEGKLAATVSGGGFTVHTPTATVLDLGTEFGISAIASTTDVEVFKGKIQATARSANTSGSPPQTMTQGQAAAVSGGVITLDPNGAVPQRFVRSLSTNSVELDVVDLVAGGDGTTHLRGLGIDPANGQIVRGKPANVIMGDGIYHRVTMLPVVDGCFVPDGTRGPVQVNSNGDRFVFPPTSGTSFDRIWTGGPIPSPTRPLLTSLGGVDYSQPGHGLLFLQSNTGLTLDLSSVRRLHPGSALRSFHCIVGNSFVATREPASTVARADAFVVVDGKSRFERRGFSNHDEPFSIDITLGESDRFLTLTTTDGGDRAKFDWVLWADPVLKSLPIAKH